MDIKGIPTGSLKDTLVELNSRLTNVESILNSLVDEQLPKEPTNKGDSYNE